MCVLGPQEREAGPWVGRRGTAGDVACALTLSVSKQQHWCGLIKVQQLWGTGKVGGCGVMHFKETRGFI